MLSNRVRALGIWIWLLGANNRCHFRCPLSTEDNQKPSSTVINTNPCSPVYTTFIDSTKPAGSWWTRRMGRYSSCSRYQARGLAVIWDRLRRLTIGRKRPILKSGGFDSAVIFHGYQFEIMINHYPEKNMKEPERNNVFEPCAFFCSFSADRSPKTFWWVSSHAEHRCDFLSQGWRPCTCGRNTEGQT